MQSDTQLFPGWKTTHMRTFNSVPHRILSRQQYGLLYVLVYLRVIHLRIWSQLLHHTKGQYLMHFWIPFRYGSGLHQAQQIGINFTHQPCEVDTHAGMWNEDRCYAIVLVWILDSTVWKCWVMGLWLPKYGSGSNDAARSVPHILMV